MILDSLLQVETGLTTKNPSHKRELRRLRQSRDPSMEWVSQQVKILVNLVKLILLRWPRWRLRVAEQATTERMIRTFCRAMCHLVSPTTRSSVVRVIHSGQRETQARACSIINELSDLNLKLLYKQSMGFWGFGVLGFWGFGFRV